MYDFKRLDVWKAAHALTLRIYSVTTAFPRHELFGLTNQLRRAAVSIPANLAEGCGREGQTELARFAAIALGSANELEYLLLLAKDLGYAETNDLVAATGSVSRMLNRFRAAALRSAKRSPAT